MAPLRQRVIEEVVRRNHGDRTIKTYVGAIAAIAKHYKEPPTMNVGSFAPRRVRISIE
jgi:hypothetical protein